MSKLSDLYIAFEPLASEQFFKDLKRLNKRRRALASK